MGDPGLVAGQHPVVAVPISPCFQRPEVRSGVRLGEHRRRQNLAAGDLRQPVFLLRPRAPAEDQLGRDLGPGAEAPDPDITPAKLLGNHAHCGLSHARAAELFRDGQAEHAQFRHLLDDRHRDQLVAQVPAMGVGRHPVVGKAAELLAHQAEFLVEGAVAEGGNTLALGHDRGQPHPRRVTITRAQTRHRRIGAEGRQHRLADPDIGGPDDLALAHRDAAGDLGEVFAAADGQDQPLDLAQLGRRLQPCCPARHLAQACRVGGQPGQPVGGVLLGLQHPPGDPAPGADPQRQQAPRRAHQRLGRGGGGPGQAGQIGIVMDGRVGGGRGLGGHRAGPRSSAAPPGLPRRGISLASARFPIARPECRQHCAQHDVAIPRPCGISLRFLLPNGISRDIHRPAA